MPNCGHGDATTAPPQTARKAKQTMQIRCEKNKLILEIDVSPETLKAAPPSSSGKAKLVASTSGWTRVLLPNGQSVSITAACVTK